MNFNFDINKNYEIPLITLCNPDRTEISSISNSKNLHINKNTIISDKFHQFFLK